MRPLARSRGFVRTVISTSRLKRGQKTHQAIVGKFGEPENSSREMAGRPESRPRASRSLFVLVIFVSELTSVGVVLYVENALAKFVVLGE
jgi:hypothetical protein